MSAVRTEWTVDMLDELPDDGNRYELIDGELFVSPAPSIAHQLVVLALALRLRTYLRPSELARVLISPADIRRDDRSKNRLQPDVFAVRLIDGKHPTYPYDLADILLAAEVESPGHRLYDYQTKRHLYLSGGIPEYWIVSAETRSFVRWHDSGDEADLLTTRIEWHPAGMPDPLVIDIPEFFEDALG